MNAQEFRIGNLVWYLRNCTVREIGSKWVGLSYDTTDKSGKFVSAMWNNVKLRPIPLTEDWLLRAGFVKDDEYGWYSKCFVITEQDACSKLSINVNTCSCLINNDEDDIVIPAYIGTRRYIHLLQNLWHSLTGAELEFKPL